MGTLTFNVNYDSDGKILNVVANMSGTGSIFTSDGKTFNISSYHNSFQIAEGEPTTKANILSKMDGSATEIENAIAAILSKYYPNTQA